MRQKKRQEHTSNARKSSEQKHEYGLTRKDQKYNDKKGHSPDGNKIQIKRNKI